MKVIDKITGREIKIGDPIPSSPDWVLFWVNDLGTCAAVERPDGKLEAVKLVNNFWGDRVLCITQEIQDYLGLNRRP
jgi:hypothetical protein